MNDMNDINDISDITSWSWDSLDVIKSCIVGKGGQAIKENACE